VIERSTARGESRRAELAADALAGDAEGVRAFVPADLDDDIVGQRAIQFRARLGERVHGTPVDLEKGIARGKPCPFGLTPVRNGN
jgi:hypothetical protein